MLEAQLRSKLYELNLKSMADALENNFESYLKQDLSFFEILNLVCDYEVQARSHKKIERLIKNAKFSHTNACLEDINYAPTRQLKKNLINQFATDTWLLKKQNILIFGATGAGKTWLSCALGNQACRNGFDTAFISCHAFIEGLKDALYAGKLSNYKKRFIKPKLLIVDDFALDRIDSDVAPMLLDIIDNQSRVGSLMVTSQSPVETWRDKFDNATLAEAITDRILEQAHRIDIKGDSMRKMAEPLKS